MGSAGTSRRIPNLDSRCSIADAVALLHLLGARVLVGRLVMHPIGYNGCIGIES